MKKIDCKECNGMGYIIIGAGDHEASNKCPDCNGTGQIEPQPGMPLVTRERAEFFVGEKDCGERAFEPIEKEDLIRTFLYGAEVQRDKDYHDSLPKIIEARIRELVEALNGLMDRQGINDGRVTEKACPSDESILKAQKVLYASKEVE